MPSRGRRESADKSYDPSLSLGERPAELDKFYRRAAEWREGLVGAVRASRGNFAGARSLARGSARLASRAHESDADLHASHAYDFQQRENNGALPSSRKNLPASSRLHSIHVNRDPSRAEIARRLVAAQPRLD